jgi:hypothetical protein
VSPTEQASFDLTRLADIFSEEAMRASDPRLVALFETSSEVLRGLAAAFADHPQCHEGS